MACRFVPHSKRTREVLPMVWKAFVCWWMYDTTIRQTGSRIMHDNKSCYELHLWHSLSSHNRMEQQFSKSWSFGNVCYRAIHKKGAPLQNCFGLIDGTVRPICMQTRTKPEGCIQWPQKGTCTEISISGGSRWNDSKPLWTCKWVFYAEYLYYTII